MVGPTCGVQEKVPVSPADCPEEEIFQGIQSQRFGPTPPDFHVVAEDNAAAVAGLGAQNELVRRCEVRIVEVSRLQTSVPMHTDPIKVLPRQRVAIEHLGPVVNVVLVVVEAHDDHARMVAFENRPEVVSDKLHHVLRRVEARLPANVRLRLVLHGDAPKFHAFLLVCVDEGGHVLCPGAHVLLVQAVWHSTLRHPPATICRWVLHPSRRAPGRGVGFQFMAEAVLLAACRQLVLRIADELQHARLLVVVHGVVEVREIDIPSHIVKVVGFWAEVARPNWNAANAVTVAAVLRVCEVKPDNFLLILRRHLHIVDRGCLGEGSAEADNLLKLGPAVHRDGGSGRFPHGLHLQRGHLTQKVRLDRVIGSLHDAHGYSCNGAGIQQEPQ
mmetsp:Transcript_49211/g.107031  ORF Transcript_49211/g.107031 Transcript_49211/m.107031 type:complete len:386 (+) Transcript_49211:1161-2318(+)